MALGEELTTAFFKDFQDKISTICYHHKLEFVNQPMYVPPMPKIHNDRKITDFFKVLSLEFFKFSVRANNFSDFFDFLDF